MVAKGDSANFIVPKHIWEDKDWAEYTAYNDGAGPVTTSPWRFSYADDTRRIIDRVETCDDWWACRTGLPSCLKSSVSCRFTSRISRAKRRP